METQRFSSDRRARPPLRIAMLAPPWIPVPAPGYGGVETVIEQLCARLVGIGHDVTLFAAPGSRSPAAVRPILNRAHPQDIGMALYEGDHVALVMEAVDRAAAAGAPFDVVHDHSGFVALAMADRLATPMVHTLHGSFTADTSAFYRRHGHKACLVSISATQRRSAPASVEISAIVPNPITISEWPLVREKGRHLLWLGRIDEIKGPHRAILAARLADRPLVIAGPVQTGHERFFAEQVEPQVDGSRVSYVGEIGGASKRRILSEAAALLMPIRWEEPFGMVMVEALACGTPVIAFPEGAAREIIVDGVNGFLVEDEHAMARAVARLGEIDADACRASVADRYDVAHVAAGYERVYRRVAPELAARRARGPDLGRLALAGRRP